MNITKATSIIAELNEDLKKVTDLTVFTIQVFDAPNFTVHCFGHTIYNSVENDCYTDNGKLLDFKSFLDYCLRKVVFDLSKEYTKIQKFLSNQLELELDLKENI